MKEIYAVSFHHGWSAFTGGYFANIITPEDGGTCYPVRPDGSLTTPRKASKRQLTELRERQAIWEPLKELFSIRVGPPRQLHR